MFDTGLKLIQFITFIILDQLRILSALKNIGILKYGDRGQFMSAAKLCLEAVLPRDQLSPGTNYRQAKFNFTEVAKQSFLGVAIKCKRL